MKTRRTRPIGRRRRCEPVVEGLQARLLLAVTFQTHYVLNTQVPVNFSPSGVLANSIALGPDQNLWFAASNENNNLPQSPLLGSVLSMKGTVTGYTPASNPTVAGLPSSIVSGPGGDLWYINTTYNSSTGSSIYDIASLDPTTGSGTNYPISITGAVLAGLAVGADGNLWFTDSGVGAIGMFNPTTHAATEYPLSGSGNKPTLITPGHNGDLFFTNYVGESAIYTIGEINPTTHAITQTAFSNAQSTPVSITAGPDNKVWSTRPSGRATRSARSTRRLT
jgi:virginiamycin B lyase